MQVKQLFISNYSGIIWKTPDILIGKVVTWEKSLTSHKNFCYTNMTAVTSCENDLGVLKKFYRERLRPEVQPVTLLYTFWIVKVRIPLSNFVYLLARNPLHIHSLELCIPFNCCKCSVSWVKHKTTTFSRLFPSHKIHMFALLDLYFYRPEVTDFPTLSVYIYLKPKKGTYSTTAEPPRTGHYRGVFPGGRNNRLRL